MNKLSTFSSATALTLLVTASVAGTAVAWHPQGQIIKSVQNLTTNGKLSDANTAAAAVSAKPGDILQYTVEIKNIAPAASNHDNDMAFVGMADALPAGVVLVDTPNVRVVTAQPDNIVPGQSFVKTFKVKVTETTDGKLIENSACYSADSTVKDQPIDGCDVADIKVSNPTPVTPPATTTPDKPVVATPAKADDLAVPAELPNTGIGSVVPVAGTLTALVGYAANALRLKRRVQA